MRGTQSILSNWKFMFVRFFSLGKFSLFLWWFPPLFSLSVTTIVRILVFFSGTAFHCLSLRNLLLRSKHRGLYLSRKFPYLLEGNQRSLHKEAGRLVGGGGWKYGLELASFSSITCLITKTSSHLMAERETGPTPGSLGSILSVTVGWSWASRINFWVAVLSSVNGNVEERACPA